MYFNYVQHLEQTAGFDASNVLMLVLDEADRILDMGFKAQLDSLLEYLPPSRQTLLFSATQTKSVKDLARLSLRSPEYLAVHADDSTATPLKLHQNYIVCPLHEKLDVLFSFIKSHLKSKIIVFMSTCAQVRFVHECFKGMQPGIPLVALHGKIKQEKRTIVFLDFARRKSAVLFATDIAARGLDFPDVDWVFQLDAPEDTAMYIHRVGRTARYQSGGRALMALMPTEEKAVVDKLKTVGVDLKKLSVNKKQYMSVATQASALLVSRPECRLLAKKAFIGYLRALQNLPVSGHQTQPVDLLKLPVDAFSMSLGLAFTPALPTAPPSGATTTDGKSKKNVNRALDKLKRQIKEAKERRKARAVSGDAGSDTGSSSDEDEDNEKTEMEKLIKTHGKKKARLLMTNRSLRPVSQGDEGEEKIATDDNEDDGLLVVKQVHNKPDNSEDDSDGEPLLPATLEPSSRAMKRKLGKIRASGASAAVDSLKTQRIKFDEDGSAVNLYGQLKGATDGSSDIVDAPLLQDRVRSHMESVKKRIDAVRTDDEALEKERVREKHKKNRLLRRDENKEKLGAGADSGAVLSNVFEEEEGSDDGYSSDGSDDGASDASSDDVSDESVKHEKKNKKRPKSYEDSSESEDEKKREISSSKKKKKRRTQDGSDEESPEMSIEEQERLALKLLK